MAQTYNLTEGKVSKVLLGFFFPMLFTNLLQQIYTFADTAIVEKGLGDNALAAVGNLSSLNLLVVGFFTMTDAGVAFAKNIYRVIVWVTDGLLLAQGDSALDDAASIDYSGLPAEFESLEAVAAATGREIVIPGGEDILTSFTVHTPCEDMVVIRSEYSRENGDQYIISQTLYYGGTLWGSAINTTGSISASESGVGAMAYLSTMDDGMVYGEIYADSCSLNISSVTMKLDDLKDILSELKYVS